MCVSGCLETNTRVCGVDVFVQMRVFTDAWRHVYGNRKIGIESYTHILYTLLHILYTFLDCHIEKHVSRVAHSECVYIFYTFLLKFRNM